MQTLRVTMTFCIKLLKLRKAKIGSTNTKHTAVKKLKDPATKQDFTTSLKDLNHMKKETALTFLNLTFMRTSLK